MFHQIHDFSLGLTLAFIFLLATIFFMLVIASSCGLMRVHAALINPHFFKNGDVSSPSRYEKQTPRKIPNEINRLLADFDSKTVDVPDFLNGLYLS